MRVLVQRSGNASVKVDGKIVGEIESGLVLLVGFTNGDTIEEVKLLAKKCANLRIFPDEDDVMNKSLLDFGGDILSISQFTLYGDAKKGNRPSYINAMKNDEAIPLYEAFNEELRTYGVKVETGIFGADMDVALTNIGPTTIWLEK
ncbi:MAG: D-tyrosyl-tRNA(Tyr) deacylase [Bacilli bacterium]|nr:D-tyrosyl-tRNA(Tyr) deacylase [Bacilli bacterium]